MQACRNFYCSALQLYHFPLASPSISFIIYTKDSLPVLKYLSIYAAYNNIRFAVYLFVVRPGLFSLAMDLMLALQLQISGNWGLSLNVTQQFMNI